MVTAEIITQLAIDSLLLGLIYGLMSLGLSLTFGVMGVINVAHGAFYMLAGYIAFTVASQIRLPIWIGLVAAVLFLFLVGIAIEIISVERVKADPNSSMLMTMGFAILLENVVLLIYGGLFRTNVPFLAGTVVVAPYFFGLEQAFGAVFAVAAAAGLSIFLARSRTGKAIRMLGYDRETSMILGIKVSLVAMITFGIGASTAGMAGVLLTTLFPMNPDVGWNILIITFAVVILGGVGSIKGTMVGGIIYAFAQNLTGLFFPQFSTIVGLGLLVAILLVRPAGLFGSEYVTVERA